MNTLKAAARWALLALRSGLTWSAAALVYLAEQCKRGAARLEAATAAGGK